jgi:hypothetical protein
LSDTSFEFGDFNLLTLDQYDHGCDRLTPLIIRDTDHGCIRYSRMSQEHFFNNEETSLLVDPASIVSASSGVGWHLSPF